MRTTVMIAVLGCSLLATAGCKQETTVPAADATTTTVIPVPGPTSTETNVVTVPVPGPTATETNVVVVPGATVTETAAPAPTEKPKL